MHFKFGCHDFTYHPQEGKIRQSMILSIIIAIDLFIKDRFIIIPIIGDVKMLYNIMFPVLIVYEIINVIIQCYRVMLVYK